MESAQKKSRNPIAKVGNYIRESNAEMRKVTWPTRREVVKYSAITIGISLLIAGFFAGLDYLLDLGIRELIQLSS